MNVTRRLFFGGSLAILAATQLPTIDDAPTLWCDGVHDDAPALNAWVKGLPVRMNRYAGATVGRVHMINDARIVLGSTLVMDGPNGLWIMSSVIKRHPGFQGDTLISLPASAITQVVMNCHLDPPSGMYA